MPVDALLGHEGEYIGDHRVAVDTHMSPVIMADW